MCTAAEETNIEAILAVMNATAILTHDLCDTGAALYQL